MTAPRRRISDHPIRITLANELGGDLDGAWWPYTSSMARELPDLVDAVEDRLGKVVDIAVNWSPLQGTPEFVPASSQFAKPLPGQKAREHRIIAVAGSHGAAKLLVVPPRTSRALAVMVLRQAAALPIHFGHVDTTACQIAAEIVRVARTQCGPRAEAKTDAVTLAD